MVKHASKATVHQLAKEYSSIIKGKTILTTGVSPGGLGALFVEAIAVAEPELAILAGRNINKLQQTADHLASKHPNLKTKLLTLDLSSLASVRSAAQQVNGWSDVHKIDVLVNNAGIMATDFKLTEDGFENQFASNHLGHFLFTNLIIDKILAAEAPRIVSVSSNGHRLGPIRWGDANFSVSFTIHKLGSVLTIGRMEIYTTDGTHTDSPRLPTCYSPSLWLRSSAVVDCKHTVCIPVLSLKPPWATIWPIWTVLVSHHEFFVVKLLTNLVEADRAIGDPWGWVDWSTVPVTAEVGAATHVFAAFDPDLKG